MDQSWGGSVFVDKKVQSSEISTSSVFICAPPPSVWGMLGEKVSVGLASEWLVEAVNDDGRTVKVNLLTALIYLVLKWIWCGSCPWTPCMWTTTTTTTALPEGKTVTTSRLKPPCSYLWGFFFLSTDNPPGRVHSLPEQCETFLLLYLPGFGVTLPSRLLSGRSDNIFL